jgi:hypothetical protein
MLEQRILLFCRGMFLIFNNFVFTRRLIALEHYPVQGIKEPIPNLKKWEYMLDIWHFYGNHALDFMDHFVHQYKNQSLNYNPVLVHSAESRCPHSEYRFRI